MIAILNGMAVLLVKIVMAILCYLVLSRIEWRKFFKEKDRHYVRVACFLISLALGQLISSFFIEIIQIMQSVLWGLYT